MKKALLLLALLVTSVSLANASKPNGPLTINPNRSYINIDNLHVDVDVFRDHISFFFDHPVSHVCVENINTGKSFSGYFTPATCCPSMGFAPGNGTWVIKADGIIYGRFNIGFVTWPDPFDGCPEMNDPWGENAGGLDHSGFGFSFVGGDLFPVDWIDDGNGPVSVWFHF